MVAAGCVVAAGAAPGVVVDADGWAAAGVVEFELGNSNNDSAQPFFGCDGVVDGAAAAVVVVVADAVPSVLALFAEKRFELLPNPPKDVDEELVVAGWLVVEVAGAAAAAAAAGVVEAGAGVAKASVGAVEVSAFSVDSSFFSSFLSSFFGEVKAEKSNAGNLEVAAGVGGGMLEFKARISLLGFAGVIGGIILFVLIGVVFEASLPVIAFAGSFKSNKALPSVFFLGNEGRVKLV